MQGEASALLPRAAPAPASQWRQWVALCVVSLASSFTHVPVIIWDVLEPLMLDDGVLQLGEEGRLYAHRL